MTVINRDQGDTILGVRMIPGKTYFYRPIKPIFDRQPGFCQLMDYSSVMQKCRIRINDMNIVIPIKELHMDSTVTNEEALRFLKDRST